MAERPIIGLPGRRSALSRIEGIPANLGHLTADVYFSGYALGVHRAGGLPVHLPLDVPVGEWAGVLDGVLLPGGADVDPCRYGQANTKSHVESLRDDIEFGLLDVAMMANLPVLGVCRGLQVINVFYGGTLTQDLPVHARYDVDPAAATHPVAISEGSTLCSLYGTEFSVNTLHHQAVDVLGPGLTVTATAADGTIEGVEAIGEEVVAVQWHPEMMNADDPSFRWLVAAARRRRARR